MELMMKNASVLSFGFLVSLFTLSHAKAATPSVTNSLPSSSFAGEQTCFVANLTNSGTPGFGPYLRVFSDSSLNIDSAEMFGSSLNISTVGVFAATPGNQLTDPISGETVSGTGGQRFSTIVLPVGSVVTNGPDLTTTVCVSIDTGANIGTALDFSVQPVYEFGDTATGDNGPVAGILNTQSVTPTVISYAFDHNASESERVPGAAFPIGYTHTVDVANGKTVSNLGLQDILGSNLQFTASAPIAGGNGCSVDTSPSTSTPGGTLTMSCTEIAGATTTSDVTLSYNTYVPDILDEAICAVSSVTNTGALDSEFPVGIASGQLTDTASVTVKHLAIQQGVSAGVVVPGETLTVTNQVQLSAFATANNLVVTDTLPDGLTFNAHSDLDIGGTVAITPTVVVNADSTTTVTYDIHGVTGDLSGGTTLSLQYTVTVNETYNDTGASVLASDSLGINTSAEYALIGGAAACIDTSSAKTSIQAITTGKSILSPKAEYMPGETLTFRLFMSIPSGDTQDIVFEDFLPLPVFDVSDISTIYGMDVTLAANDMAGLMPISISRDIPTNALQITWPDLTTSGTEVIAVDISATIVDEPFADGLSLTNLFQGSTKNTVAEQAVVLDNVALVVRAPALSVSMSDDAAAIIDAGDVITYTLSIENQGGADAYDVTIDAPTITGLDGAVLSSVTIDSTPSNAYTGTLAAGNFRLDDPVAPGSTVLISYTRDVSSTVTPRQEIESTASTVWASNTGATAFPAQNASTTLTVGSAEVDVSVDAVSPEGFAGNLVVGDIVTYLLSVTLPEGQANMLNVDVALPAGLEYVASSVNVDTTGFGGVVDTSPTIGITGSVASGQSVAVAFDSPITTVVTGDNVTSNNTFTFTLDATVNDVTANSAISATQTKTASADLTYAAFSGAAVGASVDSDFAEHNLSVSTSISPASALQAGDTITTTIEVENTGTAPAYDVVIISVLNSDLLDTASAAEGTTALGYSYGYSDPTVTYALDSGSLDAGDSVTFTYTAVVKDSVQSGASFNVEASASADSQDGTVSGERSATDSANEMASTANPTLNSVTLLSSSESWTSVSGTPVFAIGEVATYRVVSTLPEGITNETGADALIEVTLPAGFAYVAGSALLRGVFDSGLSSTNIGALPSTDTAASVTVSSNVLELNLGSITNIDNDANDEQVLLTFDVLVLNTTDNNRTDSKTLTGWVHYINQAAVAQSGSATATSVIGIPNLTLTNVASPDSVAGGDTVTYTLTATNVSGTNVVRGWDWGITQILPSRLQNPVVTGATLSRGATDIETCAGFSGNDLTVDASCLTQTERYLAPGESITVTYTATVDATIGFEEQVDTTADFTLTTLPGDNGTADAAPGTPDSDIGERTGSQNDNTSGQAVNDLVAMQSETITSGAPTLSLAASQANANIGDTVTLTATFGIPTGTTNDFVYTLDVPSGLSYNNEAIAITLPASNFSATNSLNTTPGAGTDPIVLDFGAITNSATTSQTVTIAVQLIVDNVIANQNGLELGADASLSYQGVSLPAPASSATVTVVEPNLLVEQTIIAGATGSDAGDSIAYQTVLTNTATQSTAYQVALTDLFPEELLGAPDGSGSGAVFESIMLTNTTADVVLSGGNILATASDITQTTTTFAGDTLTLAKVDMPPSSSITLTYEVVVSNGASAGDTATNRVSVSYNSLLSGNGRDGSSVGSDDDDDAMLNNYNESDSNSVTLANSIAIQSGLNAVHSNNDFTPGDTVTLDVRVDVVEGDVNSVEIVNSLPPSLEFVSSNLSSGSNISISGSADGSLDMSNVVTIDLGTVTNVADADLSNDFFILSLVTRVLDDGANVHGATLQNSANVSGGGATAGPTLLNLDILEPSLDVSLVASRSTVTLGDTVTYTFTATPAVGSSNAFDTTLEVAIPTGLTFVADSNSGQGTIDDSDPTLLTVDLGTVVVVDGAKTFSFDVTVDNDANIGEALQVAVQNGVYSSVSGTNVNERSYTFNTSASVVSDDASFITADQTMVLSVDANANGYADPGDTLDIAITLENTGSDTTGVVFTEAIPLNTRYVAASASASGGTVDDTGDITVDIGTLLAGDTVTVGFSVTVENGVPDNTLISAQGSVDSDLTVPEPTDADGDDSNGDQANTLRTGGPADDYADAYVNQTWALTFDADSDDAVSAGDTLTLSYVIDNTGTQSLTNLVLNDVLPIGLTYVGGSATINGGNTVDVTGGDISASVANLGAGDSVSVSLQVVIDVPMVDFTGGTTDEVFTLQATTSSDQTDNELADSNGSAVDGYQALTINAVDGVTGAPLINVNQSWLLVVDADGDGLVDPGDTVRFLVLISNLGSERAEGISLSQPIPSNTRYSNGSATISQGAITSTTPFAANIGDIAPGSRVTASFDVIIDPVADGTVIAGQSTVSGSNISTVVSDDNNNADDGDNDTLVVVTTSATAAITSTLSLTDSSEPSTTEEQFIQGETLDMVFNVTLPPSSVSDGQLALTLPSGMTIGAGSTTLTRVFDTGLRSADNPGNINAAASDVAVSVMPDVTGERVTLFLGGIINSDNDGNDEQYQLRLTLETAALVPTTISKDLTVKAEFAYRDNAGVLHTEPAADLILNFLNRAPTAGDDSVTVTEDADASSLAVLTNDSDLDLGQTLVVLAINSVNNGGNAVVSADGTIIEYQPAADFFGMEVINYTLSDGAGGTDTAEISVSVTSTPDAPNAENDAAEVDEDESVTIMVLANDVDVDGDTLSVISANVDTGVVAINADDELVYTPEANFNGTAIITYTIDDGTGLVDSASVTVAVRDVNDSPAAANDVASLDEDTSTNINVLSNDSDIDGDSLSVASATASSGEVSINPDNTLTYIPEANFNGDVTITYTISDGRGGSDTAEITVSVISSPDAPNAGDDVAEVGEGESVTIIVLANDVDVDGDTLSVISASVDTGAVVVNAEGELIYTPDENFNGTAIITYTIDDGTGLVDTASVTVTVQGVNDLPTAVDDVASLDEDTSTNIDVLSNDGDLDGDSLSVASVVASSGEVFINPDNTLTYTPDANFNGNVIISYTISDGRGGTASATVAVTVNSINDAPEVGKLSADVDINTPATLDVLAVSSDVDGDILAVSSATSSDGTAVIGSDGTVTFTPTEGFEGTATVIICVQDSNEAETCVEATVNVNNPNTAPAVEDRTIDVDEDSSVSLSLAGTDNEGDTLTYTLLSAPQGDLTGDLPNVTYTPPVDFTGTDTFTYQANDGQLDSNVATITLSIGGQNDAPIAVDDVLALTTFTTLEIDVLANDSDPDGDTLTIVGVTSTIGDVSWSDTMVSYTPVEGFVGNAVLEYSIEDPSGLTATARVLVGLDPEGVELLPEITVPDDVLIDATALFTKVDLGVATAVDRFGNPLPVSLVDGITFYEPGINTAFWLAEDSEGRRSIASQFVRVRPLISIDKDQTVLEGRSVVVGVHLNGTSPVYPLEIPYTVSGTADDTDHTLTDGVLTIVSGSSGEIRFDTFFDEQEEENEQILITLSDTLNLGNKFSHVVTLNEDNVNPEVALFSTQNNEARVIVTKTGGPVVVSSQITHPDHDNVFTLNWQQPQPALKDIDTQDSTFTFDPATVPVGVYRLTLAVVDADDSMFGDEEVIFIEVTETLAPLGEEDSDGDGIPDNLEGYGDADRDGIPDYMDAIPECNVLPEEAEFTNGFLVEGDPGVCLRIGNFVIDGQTGGALVTSEDVLVDPILQPDFAATNIGGIFDFIAYGLPDEGQAYKIVMPQRRPVPRNAVYRKFVPNTGWFTFVETGENRLYSTAGEPGFCPPPGGDIWEPGLVEGHWCVQIEIVDGGPNDADGLVNSTVVDPGGVAVLGVDENTLPVANDDEAELLLNTTIVITPLDNDTDEDGDSLTITSADPLFGEVSFTDTEVMYTPRFDFTGEDRIVYGISDGNGGTDFATIILGVFTNQAPVLQDDTATTLAGETVVINVLNNDNDADNDPLVVSEVSGGTGTVIVLSNNQLQYTPADDFTGDDIFTYQARDPDGATGVATVRVTVKPVVVRIENKSGGAFSAWWIALLLIVMSIRVTQGRRRKHP
ncbi:Ig-like domain-containing protein [Pseudoalteromonas spongiae]|uniref:Ig-like domain-containing protein n=1 Tax=Pseudoalteromonas spongiae TaxID=298657 RepID=UPI00110BAC6D|nr:tandem-95 repeat protein [Pseudoalteromonas spongiae]TMO83078.1 hypothetical protein CWC15_16600 [Pseudoalteromonas spongiae]